MAKQATLSITSSGAEAPEPATAMVPAPLGTTPQKRGFKPRWLRLQRRERKLREARAIAARAVIG